MNAKHGWWCGAKTYPLKCKYCGNMIFHFSCDCGSSLLFDELGKPWPLHSCADYVAGKERFRLGKETVAIAELWNHGIQAEHLQSSLHGLLGSHLTNENLKRLPDIIEQSIEKQYADSVRKSATDSKRHAKRSLQVIRQDAYHGAKTCEVGIVTEVIPNASIAKKAGLENNSLGLRALGDWARKKLTQLTIHTGALGEDETDSCSFTFFVDEAIVNQNRIVRDCIVSVKLRGIVILSRYPIWVCKELVDLIDKQL